MIAQHFSRFPKYLLLVMLVSNSGCERRGEPPPPGPPIVSVEEDIRIGSLHQPAYAFSEVGTLEVATDGSIYSLHPQEAVIRHWSAAGQPLGKLGKRGEGPGEFMAPRSIGWMGDSLWVFDENRNSRISFFDLSGTYLGTLTPTLDIGTAEQALRGIFPARPVGMLGDGTVHGATPAFSREVIARRLTSIAHVRMKLDGSTIDTILTIPVGPKSILAIDRGGGRFFTRQPFGDGVLSTLTPGGQAFLIVERQSSRSGTLGEFRLHRVELDGDTVYSRSYQYVPISIPPDTIDSYINALAERLQGSNGASGGPTSARWADLIRDAMYTPEFYPPVGQLVAGRDGTIWLARSPGNAMTTEWLVLKSDGSPIVTVAVPRAMNLMMAAQSMIWGTERDEFDVDHIVRYRVRFPDAN